MEFNLLENAKLSLEFIKEEDEVVEFCEKWFIWAENFDLPNEEIYYEKLEKLKGSFLKEFQYEFGIIEYLLQGINKKNKSREELFHRIISTKKTMLSLINLFNLLYISTEEIDLYPFLAVTKLISNIVDKKRHGISCVDKLPI